MKLYMQLPIIGCFPSKSTTGRFGWWLEFRWNDIFFTVRLGQTRVLRLRMSLRHFDEEETACILIWSPMIPDTVKRLSRTRKWTDDRDGASRESYAHFRTEMIITVPLLESGNVVVQKPGM